MAVLSGYLRPRLRSLTSAVTEGGGGGLQPWQLFANGELGGWYDVTDRETARYRLERKEIIAGDNSGSAQELGFLFDKKGWNGGALHAVLGANSATNGEFATDTVWSKGTGWTISGGKAQITSAASASNLTNNSAGLVIGRSYLVTVVIDSMTGGALRVFAGSGDSATVSLTGFTPGTVELALRCAGSTSLILQAPTGCSCVIESVSVREVPGSAALQATQSLVPKYTAGGYANHDGVDDKLAALYPSSLGAACTVAYSTISGVTYLDAQTIGTTYDLPAADWFECVVINRALTTLEKTKLTANLTGSRDASLAAAIAVWGDSMAVGSGATGTALTWSYLLQGKFAEVRPRFNGGAGGSDMAATRDRIIADLYYNGSVVILWDKYNTGEGVATWEAAMADSIAALTTSHFVILSPTNGESEGSPSAYYTDMLAINAWLAATYPANYYDVRRYLIDNGLTDAGITPTAQDLIDVAADTIPASLRADTVHLNNAAQALVAQKVYEFIAAKGW